MTDRKPWYFTHQQWDEKLAQDARWAAPSVAAKAAATTPQIPAGVPLEIWDQMTPAEQAKLYADQANTRAAVQASQSTKNTLWLIFVVIPAVLVLLWLIFGSLSHSS
jgi:hypothetical protein